MEQGAQERRRYLAGEIADAIPSIPDAPHRADSDEWTSDGPSVTARATQDAIRDALERGPVLVEHWHYRGARGPSHLVFDGYQAFCEYLEAEAIAGDALDVWAWAELCTPERRLAEGKCPAEDGTVPSRGARRMPGLIKELP